MRVPSGARHFFVMKKPYTLLALVLLVFLALIPPIEFFVRNPSNDMWFVMVLFAGFMGFLTLFLKTTNTLRAIAIGSFIICFFGTGAYICFTSYVSIICGCYLYIVCCKIEDWKLMFKGFGAVLLLNMLLVLMQSCGTDSLLNFGLGREFTCYGIIGQHMQMGSFAVVLSAILLPTTLWPIIFPFVIAIFCASSWTLLAAGAGVFTLLYSYSKRKAEIFLLICILLFTGYSYSQGKFASNIEPKNGRLQIWEKSLAQAAKKPLTGWGPGTYKMLFPAMNPMGWNVVPYKTAHNAFVELAFEFGYVVTAWVIWRLILLGIALYEASLIRCLAGLIMISMDAMVHFPDRMLQTVGLLICFLAYCEVQLRQKRLVSRPI